MVGSYRNCGLSAGVIFGLLIFYIFQAECSLKPFRICELGVLNQSVSQAHIMVFQAKDLYNISVYQQEFQETGLCNTPVAWLSIPNITRLPSSKMLQKINQSLHTFLGAFKVLNKCRVENEFFSKLQETKKSISALQSNIFSALCNKRTTFQIPKSIAIPEADGVFDEKLQCCQVLKTYMDFMVGVESGLQRLREETARKMALLQHNKVSTGQQEEGKRSKISFKRQKNQK
ncbi:uncharacterized protein LOC116406767 [Xenopus tropicalis]|uniref:Uncharacterized protein LOC116406767 n=1 Tax=Xenopus tropicalis TaxID=8364 RepID=A0A8J1ISP7_XENTR|nr:uncharacterized protein LOC116406767 [Xenopus tropicalis]